MVPLFHVSAGSLSQLPTSSKKKKKNQLPTLHNLIGKSMILISKEDEVAALIPVEIDLLDHLIEQLCV